MKTDRGTRITLAFAAAAGLAGCNAPDNLPLVFHQATTVGITANASPAQGSPEISLGYRDTDVAVVPVIAGGKKVRGVSPTSPDGNLHPPAVDGDAVATETTDKKKHTTYQDALSVFGQFQVDTSAADKGTVSVGLGKFFATGLAARSLATGYECKLAGAAKC